MSFKRDGERIFLFKKKYQLFSGIYFDSRKDVPRSEKRAGPSMSRLQTSPSWRVPITFCSTWTLFFTSCCGAKKSAYIVYGLVYVNIRIATSCYRWRCMGSEHQEFQSIWFWNLCLWSEYETTGHVVSRTQRFECIRTHIIIIHKSIVLKLQIAYVFVLIYCDSNPCFFPRRTRHIIVLPHVYK